MSLFKDFAIYKNHAFAMSLNNGYRLLIGIGPKYMCENFDAQKNDDFPTRYFTYQSNDCEVQVFRGHVNVTEEFFATHFEGHENKNLNSTKVAEIISLLNLLEN
jgi:hypothetical protein